MKIVVKSLALALLSILVTARVAFAYIDPSTGGMLFQALAAGLAVLTGFALIFSRQIRMLIGRVRRSLRRTSGADDRGPQDAVANVPDIKDEKQQ